MTILMVIGMVFMIISEMFHERISLNSMLLLLLVNFVSGFRLKFIYIYIYIYIYIPHRKYQVKPHLSPWFTAASDAANSKVKFRHSSNHCKRVLEAIKLADATNVKESITSQKLGS